MADTIVALSSGGLPSGLAVVRLSGPDAISLAEAVGGPSPSPRTLALRSLRDPSTGDVLDRGMVVVFPAPASFTGEDCAELQAHGSPAGIKALLAALVGTGRCRLANAGEFTRRAFENGKMDLTAIEGLGDMLAAETEAQRRQALLRMHGGLATRAQHWRSALIDARAELEAHLDFADEDDVPADLPARFWEDLVRLRDDLRQQLGSLERGRIVREGVRVVLYGAPNAGKSSLLNALAGSDVAVVTDEAGTTRDTKEVAIDLDGVKLVLVDTAGVRETDSVAEAAGIARTQSTIRTADLVLWLQSPDTSDLPPPDVGCAVWPIRSKADLATAAPAGIAVSTIAVGGLEPLVAQLRSYVATLDTAEPSLVSHIRDGVALSEAAHFVDAALAVGKPRELVGEDLRLATQRLSELIGLVDSEAVLDRLFAGFCIGK